MSSFLTLDFLNKHIDKLRNFLSDLRFESKHGGARMSRSETEETGKPFRDSSNNFLTWLDSNFIRRARATNGVFEASVWLV